MSWLDEVRFNDDGLVAAVAQDHQTGEVLMLAWMSRESLARTLELGEAVYWSRSKGRFWHKGESSGHTQRVHELRLDCDGDTVLLGVEQVGGIACHTGHRSCFYRRLREAAWEPVEPPRRDPAAIYGDKANERE
jgi:phosphoribosyl-AMP cyclohydrolase